MSTPEYSPAPARGAVTAALTAFPLAVLCLWGSAVLTGSTYVGPVVAAISSGPSVKTYSVVSALVSAVFPLFALVLARRGAARVAVGDPSWVVPLLRAASFLAIIAIVLRVVLAVLLLLNTNGFYDLPVRTSG